MGGLSGLGGGGAKVCWPPSKIMGAALPPPPPSPLLPTLMNVHLATKINYLKGTDCGAKLRDTNRFALL